ncbi:phosphatidylglycerophosphatase A [Candidatus Omnitrophus magneticus]|uniref:Phosphatidylglycerophosphatase A n=1 Tax=Candidatus Omnitrophus magneticus TaxID=1609969 RepID=A0A0F0CTC6_9BACT|nr:phosphatidylglycerophosphatase A [Candidatus Omnitrophus magneticus]
MSGLTLKFSYAIATVFGAGKIKQAPGTWGSLLGFCFCLALYRFPFFYTAIFFILLLLGVICSEIVERHASKKDPSFIVIDEFIGAFLVFVMIPIKPSYVILGFMLYRIFDITKIFPLKQLENIKAGYGIMLDDLMAGVYANLVLQIIVFVSRISLNG